jgi:type IV secretory pathway VirD2 relaxase
VSHDQTEGHLFGRDSDRIDAHDFTEACEEDRHHFRFIVSPDDVAQLADLRALTRDLVARIESDLGTRLDWAAIDHRNTDNPHLHILIRGKAKDGRDLVISRDYVSRGLRGGLSISSSWNSGPAPPARSRIHWPPRFSRNAGLNRPGFTGEFLVQ